MASNLDGYLKNEYNVQQLIETIFYLVQLIVSKQKLPQDFTQLLIVINNLINFY